MKNQSNSISLLTNLENDLQNISFLQIRKLEPTISPEIDLTLEIIIKDQVYRLLIAYKNNGQPRYARQTTYLLKEMTHKIPNSYGIFVAPYISPDSAAILEKENIGYYDNAGNCHIAFDTIYIHQSGKPNPEIQKRSLRSMYAPKAERILRTLISHPKRIWKLTDLANTAKVSLGQVANVKKILLDKEWIENSPDGIFLSNLSDLLDEWSLSYKPKKNKLMEYYSFDDINDIEYQLASTCKQQNIPYALSGFSAAARIAPMVKYQRVSAYIKDDSNELANSLGWKPVANGGNVVLLSSYDEGVFNETRIIEDIIVTAPVQIYLDLFNQSARGEEAAAAIRREIEKSWS